jgi:hypothetical protein
MERDLLSIIISFLALFICIYFYIHFNNYKDTNNLKIIGNNLLLSNNAQVCKDTNDKVGCQPILTQGQLIKYDENKTNVYINRNTLLCDDVNDIDSCTCLVKPCTYFTKLLTRKNEQIKYINFIDKPVTFSPGEGLYFSGRLLPKPLISNSSNTFALAFFINIHKVDANDPRILLSYGNTFKLSVPQVRTDCSSDLHLQLSGETFAESCLNVYKKEDDRYYKWIHIIIQGKNNILEYYVNGNIIHHVTLKNNYNIGTIDDYIIIGSNCPGISVSNMYWFNSMLDGDQIKYLVRDKSH